MSATNKDSDKEAERASNDDGENPGGSKGDGGKENPGGSKGDGDRKNLDDMDDEDSDDDNSDDAEDDDGGENPDDTPGKKEKARRRKFEFASDLSNYIHKVRDKYVNYLEKSEKKEEKEKGVVLYIVDKFSFRSGTSTEGATGVCTLKKRDITLREENGKFFVFFDFIGKWGIPYRKTHTVEPRVYKILQELTENSTSEYLFPDITATEVNDCLKEIMPKLTMRVFRTYNGSLRMQNELEKATRDVAKGTSASTVYEKALDIVAAYLNHQRAAKPQASRSSDQNSDVLVKKMSKTSLDSPQEKAGRGQTNKKWNPYCSEEYYVDHRVVILWCKKNGIPITDIYSEEDRKFYKWDIGEVEKLVKENTSFQTFYYYYIKVFDCKYLPMELE